MMDFILNWYKMGTVLLSTAMPNKWDNPLRNSQFIALVKELMTSKGPIEHLLGIFWEDK